MDQSVALDLGRQAVQTALMVSLPILSLSLFVGVGVSVFQALTQVQEATLTFVPKVIAAAGVMVALGHWMLTTLVQFTAQCFEMAANVGRPVGL